MKTKMKMSEVSKYEDSIIAFFKFSPYIDSLIEGNLYMNNLQHYIDQEKKTGDRGQGDKLEASQVFSEIEFKMYDQETGELAFTGTSESMNLRIDGDEKKPVFCIFALTSDNLSMVEETDEFYITEMNFNDEEVEKMINEFGDQLAIIDPKNFIERVEKAFSEKGYGYVMSKVNYDDYTVNNTKRLGSYRKNNNEIFFWKDKYFENQNEYRFVITSIETDEPITVNIGDISDITTKYSAKELFSGKLQIHLRK
ncbi:hypothetical protein [Fictibacillus sp. FJAT-27399]|uniref:hypothetical protein n=1 Tax=Fictibacillus sp. FJAT-27399 TaxID=1729689 RepID=UPI000783B6AF|nr:hypothetical protein [Fictibacillus sp. FJAT-27399]